MLPWLRQAYSLLASLFRGVGNSHLGLISAGIAFFGLLALFPAITAVVTLWGFMADPEIVEQQLASYQSVFPEVAFTIIDSRVRAIAGGPKEVLGWASMLSLAAALWAARAGVGAMVGGLNAVYHVPPRGGLTGFATAMVLTLVLIAAALISLATVVAAPVVVAFLPLGQFAPLTLELLRWGIGFSTMLLGIGLIYRLGPNRIARRKRLISAGSILAVFLWGLVSIGFSRYLENFGRFNEIYGSLGAVVAMLMWFYLSAFVVMLGALVNAELTALREIRLSQSQDEDAAAPLPPEPQTEAPIKPDNDDAAAE